MCNRLKTHFFSGIFVIFFLSLFLIFPKNIQAARSITIVSDKSSLLGGEEMVITASSSGFIDGETIYIKGAFYQEGSTSNYFGYTQKNDSWVKNSQTTTDQLLIKIGEWNNTLKVKGDFSDSGYKGEGDYKFKVGFYYTPPGGNLSAIQWSDNILAININEPDPTSTPTPTPAPQPTEIPQSTNTPAPSSTPVPVSTSTPTPTIKPSLTPTKTPTPTISLSLTATPSGEVLGEEIASKSGLPQLSEEGNGVNNPKERENKSDFLFPAIAVVLGLAFIGFSIFSFLKGRRPKEVQTEVVV